LQAYREGGREGLGRRLAAISKSSNCDDSAINHCSKHKKKRQSKKVVTY
jgi:hypothetical protein